MRVLITGAKGMLAQAVRERFATGPDGGENELTLTDVVADEQIGSYPLDITDFDAVKQVISDVKPDLIINCAAYTNVDGAEQAEELARKVNVLGPENLAKAIKAVEEMGSATEINPDLKSEPATKTKSYEKGMTLVHISTDYVFGGTKPIAEVYSEDDPKEPQSVYGKTKLDGENAIVSQMGENGHYYIFRTAWLYGQGGKNFVQTMIDIGKKQEDAAENVENTESKEGVRNEERAKSEREKAAEVSVVDDQNGSPTYTKDLADIIYQAVYKQIPFGIYNATNEGFTTWADFTREIYKQARIDCKVKGISSKEYEAQAKKKTAETGKKRIVAPRPKNSQMSKEKLKKAGVTIRNWTEALRDYVKEYKN